MRARGVRLVLWSKRRRFVSRPLLLKMLLLLRPFAWLHRPRLHLLRSLKWL